VELAAHTIVKTRHEVDPSAKRETILMSPLLLTVALAAAIPAGTTDRKDVLLADFEGADYGDWKVTGEAFGSGPARGTLPNQMPVTGYLGRGLANSYHKGDDSQGTLTSPEFTVCRRRINFLIGGGHHPGLACMNLLVGGKAVRTATGTSRTPQDTEHLHWHSWDVRDLEGRRARIEIVDRKTGGWGHITVDHIVQSDREPPSERDHLLALAAESDRKAALRVKDDPTRPIYHVLAPGNWINDPNGPIFYKGYYHLFYQHNPYGDQWGHMHWGHVRSKDLVRWEHLPIALWPAKSKGEEHCFSGCAAVNNDGRLVLLYTSIGKRDPEHWAAVSEDEQAIRFRKHPANPLLTLKDHGGLKIEDWRDPFVFRAGGRWFMVTGGHRAGGKGGIFLYGSDDLSRWKFRGIPFEGLEANWECPNFFKLGEKWVLIYSPHGPVRYYTGDFDLKTYKFRPGFHGRMDGDNFYAPNCMEDPKGRRILWGWVRGFKEGRGWNGCLTLPRVLGIRADGRLSQGPAPELRKLRGKEWQGGAFPLTENDGVRVLDGLQGDTMEIAAEIEPRSAREIVLRLRRSADGRRGADIRFDGKVLDVAGTRIPCTLTDDKALRLRVFLDRSVLEVYANGSEAVTRVIYPDAKDLGVEVRASGGTAKVNVMRAWPMKSIW
jgi:sucrose-6-phosphate hydrolase SacC (GH32 family)